MAYPCDFMDTPGSKIPSRLMTPFVDDINILAMLRERLESLTSY